MKCFVCSNDAGYFCTCNQVLLCREHLPEHIQEIGHSIESLSISLSPKESQSLKKELISRLNEIKKSKAQISTLINNITIKLEKLKKAAFKELDFFHLFYSNLISADKLSKTLKIKAEIIVATKLTADQILTEFDEKLKHSFSQSLISFNEDEKLFSFIPEKHEQDNSKIRSQLIRPERKEPNLEEIRKKVPEVNVEVNVKSPNKKNYNSNRFYCFMMLLFLALLACWFEFGAFSLAKKGLCIQMCGYKGPSMDHGVNESIVEKHEVILEKFEDLKLIEDVKQVENLMNNKESEIQDKRNINDLPIKDKKSIMETYDIGDYFQFFVFIDIYKIDDIMFSSDGNAAFVCKDYIGTFR